MTPLYSLSPIRHAVCVAALLALSGCAGIAGIGGASQYACKAPPGVRCESVSATYSRIRAHQLPSQTGAAQAGATPAQAAFAAGPAPARRAPSAHPQPSGLRSDPRVLRLWVKPWEDSDRDLIDQSYVYLQVEPGRWQIEHAQRMAREPFAPVTAPVTAPVGATVATPGVPGVPGAPGPGGTPAAGTPVGQPEAGYAVPPVPVPATEPAGE